MLKKTERKWYGWRPDTPDARDYTFRHAAASLPDTVDLRPHMPPVYDQGALGSCTGNAIGGAIHYQRGIEHQRNFTPSRLFIYYNERVIEGSVNDDAGAEIRDGIKTVAKQGVCSEVVWPYVISKFATKPKAGAYTAAKRDIVTAYERVTQTADAVRTALAQNLPVIFGFAVYSSFESAEVARTGVVPMPKRSEEMLGGHAVLAVGYQNAQRRFIVRNSWGADWGDKGYFYMPYDYLLNPNLSDDLWVIRVVS